MVWPASSAARRFRSPGGARSASLRPGLASSVPRPRLHEVGASSCAAARRRASTAMSRMRAVHSAMHSSQVPEVTSRRYSLPTCAMRARIRVFAAPRALLRRLDRVRLTVHHRRLTRAQLRHRCRVHVFDFSFVRLRVAEQNTTGRGQRKGRYLLFRWVCTPTAHRRTPRLRGIRVPQGLVFDSQWFIPARAGKTAGRQLLRGPRRAHPRVGGENYWPTGGQDHATGSSPRGRGKPRGQHTQPVRVRLIPARAGKTSGECSPAHQRWAHPRAGGENLR